VGVSLQRKLSIIALVYVIEGFPMGVYADVWPVFFRRHGVSLAEIGLLAGLSIARRWWIASASAGTGSPERCSSWRPAWRHSWARDRIGSGRGCGS
jgi:hypothetical protein